MLLSNYFIKKYFNLTNHIKNIINIKYIMKKIINLINKHINLSKDHLTDINMTYIQHTKHSFSYAKTYFIASNKALLHGVFPSVFITASTDLEKQLNTISQTQQTQQAQQAQQKKN